MLMMLVLRRHLVAAWGEQERISADAHDAGTAVAFNGCQLMRMMQVLLSHLMAAFVEPSPADAHDAGPAVAFNAASPS